VRVGTGSGEVVWIGLVMMIGGESVLGIIWMLHILISLKSTTGVLFTANLG